MIEDYKQKNIVFFDGVCNLCNSSVQFIIKRNKKRNFLYTSLQSDVAREILLQFPEKNINLDSIVLLENGKIYTKSSAIFQIVRNLDGLWKIFYVFKLVPQSLSDWVYNLVAKKRYDWFGKKNACMVPDKEIQDLFL